MKGLIFGILRYCFVRASIPYLGVFDFTLVNASTCRIYCLPTRLTVRGFWLKKNTLNLYLKFKSLAFVIRY